MIGLQLIRGTIRAKARRVQGDGRATEITRCGGIIRISVLGVNYLGLIGIVIKKAISHREYLPISVT